MQENFDPIKYPTLARFDDYVDDFLSLPEVKDMDRKKIEEEICRRHPLYFFRNYGFIEQGFLDTSTTEGKHAEVEIVPFKLNTVQFAICERLCENLIYGQWKRKKAIILKCRKAGISTLMAGFDYYFMRFINNCGAFVIADKNAHTDNIYNMVIRFHANDKLIRKPRRRPMLKNKSGLKLSNGSMLELDSGETKHPGTSQTLQVLHMSENAKWAQAIDAEVSLLNSVPRKGFAWIIKESTAFGLNHYANSCLAALEKKSDWELIFISWADLEDCALELDDEEVLDVTPEERELIDTYSLSMKNLKFRRMKIVELGGKDKFKQDFPLHPREPFYEGKSNYFNVELIEDRKEEIEFFGIWKRHGFDVAMEQCPVLANHIQNKPDGPQAYLRDLSSINVLPKKVQVSWTDGKATYKPNEEMEENEGYVQMWRDPDKRRKYLVSIDPAEGISSDGYTSDNSVVEVFDTAKREQVAEFCGVFDEEITSRMSVLLAQLYNKALIVVEMNNKCGGMVWTYITEKYKYHHLYYSEKISRSQTVGREPGWRTSSKNKQEVCSRLKLDFKNGDVIIHSIPLLVEMLNFVEEKGKLHAGTGHTDDRIMAGSIGLTVIENTPALKSTRASDILWGIERQFPNRGRGEWPSNVQNLEEFPPPSMPGQENYHGRKIVRLGRS